MCKIAEETRKTTEKKIVKVDASKKNKAAAKKPGKKGKAGKCSENAPTQKIKTPKKTLISQKKKGGAVKTGASGASAKSKKTRS